MVWHADIDVTRLIQSQQIVVIVICQTCVCVRTLTGKVWLCVRDYSDQQQL